MNDIPAAPAILTPVVDASQHIAYYRVMNDERDWYNISEVAALIGVHRSTVSQYIKSGRLRVIRLGHRTIRIRKDALREFMSAQETEHKDINGQAE